MTIKRLDQYLIFQIFTVTLLITAVLVGIMLMTQSLRFLDLIITSGASGVMFLTLTLLALPRFFEVIIPVALSAATVYVFVRLRQDGELTILQTSGLSPARIARAGAVCAVLLGFLLFFILAVIAPLTLSRMYELRQTLRVQYSTSLLRPGVFNTLGSDITVFITKRTEKGGLGGVMINDARPEHKEPVTILAEQGALIITDQGPQIQVQKGIRLVRSLHGVGFDRLEFDRYIIDLPESGPLQKRWAEPEERTLINLMTTASKDDSVRAQWSEFRSEIHRRFLSPFLPLCLYLCVVLVMIKARFTRSFRDFWPIGLAGAITLIIEGGYLALFSVAKTGIFGIVLMYLFVGGILFIALCGFKGFSFKPNAFESAPGSVVSSEGL